VFLFVKVKTHVDQANTVAQMANACGGVVQPNDAVAFAAGDSERLSSASQMKVDTHVIRTGY
jgi:hypothetical protein